MNNHSIVNFASKNFALKLHSIACPVAPKPSGEMSAEENELYEAIINEALNAAKRNETLLSLAGFKRTSLIDDFLRHEGFKIVEGGSSDYLQW